MENRKRDWGSRLIPLELTILLSMIVFVFILVLLGGCRPTQDLAKESSEQTNSTDTRREADSLRISQRADRMLRAEYEEREKAFVMYYERRLNAKITDYDPSLPADPVTGKPPVKREATYTSEETSRAVQEERVRNASIIDRQRQENDSLRAVIKQHDLSKNEAKTASETVYKTGLTTWQSFQIWCGRVLLVAVLILILWVVIIIRGK